MKNLIMFMLALAAGIGIICLVMRLFKIRPLNKENSQIGPEDDSLFLEIKEDLDKEIEVLKLTAEELLNEINIKFRLLKEREIHLDSLIKLADERIEELSRKDSLKNCDGFQLEDKDLQPFEIPWSAGGDSRAGQDGTSGKDGKRNSPVGQLNNLQGSRRIYELHQKGMKSVEIARNMGMGVGEVELRIGLLGKIKE